MHSAACSGRAPTTGSSRSRATTARRGRTSRRRTCATSRASRSSSASHYAAGTAYVAANRYPAGRQAAVSLQDDRLRHDVDDDRDNGIAARRVHARGSRRSGAARPAVRRHRARRVDLVRRRRARGRRCAATCRSSRCTTSRSRKATSSPARTAARSGLSTTSPRCVRCSRRSRRKQFIYSSRATSIARTSTEAAERARRRHPTGQNPPSGAIVYYWLKNPGQVVTMDFLDASGKVIRSFTSNQDPKVARDSVRADSVRRTRADSLKRVGAPRRYSRAQGMRGEESGDEDGPRRGGGAPPRVSNKAGLNTFAWNLRHPDASTFENIIMWAGGVQGPVVVPGAYSVRLKTGR